ncbi:hypothetical protein NPIL_383401 [Nephila pilipes]|uniref:Uncharacterized protein n=1 Tax=Nephila pilipes TaxID=299642 RepID=A0A8X6QV55_NEPPI|nr:hypothetical protein NPIL_383401 [Nephila pilipes]
MSVKRSADTLMEMETDQNEYKKLKTGNCCSRCFIELPEEWMFKKCNAGIFCPNCFDELKKDWVDFINKPSVNFGELKEMFAQNPFSIPFPPKDDIDFDLIFEACILSNANVNVVNADESDEKIEEDQIQEDEILIEEEREGNFARAPQG